MTETIKKNKPIKNQFSIRRNSMCPCNSGEKWKKCCLEVVKFEQKMSNFVYYIHNKMSYLANLELRTITSNAINNNRLPYLWSWLEKNSRLLPKVDIDIILRMTNNYDDESRQKFIKKIGK